MTTPPACSTRRVRMGVGALVTSLLLTLNAGLAWAEDPIDKPNPNAAKNAPGIAGLQSLANTLTLYVIIGCLLGGLISLLMAVFGGSLSERLRETGKMGVVASIVVAFVAGLLWAIINWAYNQGAA